ncbi:MAG: hypothetical protein COB02_05465 [Candidatus Cloacimonadota bacterium]|nr:MAG: hypothetical protein COB02_05465 [Candidatus Cloacimonadota bacterium]
MKVSIITTFCILFALLLNGCGLSTTTTNLNGGVSPTFSINGIAKKGAFSSLNLTIKNPATQEIINGPTPFTSGNFNLKFDSSKGLPDFLLLEITGSYLSESGNGLKSITSSQPLSSIIATGTTTVSNFNAITPFTSILASHMGANISTQSLNDAKAFISETFGLDVGSITESRLLSGNSTVTQARRYNMLLAGISQLSDDNNGIENAIKEISTQAKEGFITPQFMSGLSSALTKISTNAFYRNSTDGAYYNTATANTLIDQIKNGTLWEPTKISNLNRVGHKGFISSGSLPNFFYWGGKSGSNSNTTTNSVLRFSSNHTFPTSTTCGVAKSNHSIAISPNQTRAYAYGGLTASVFVTNTLDIFNISSGVCIPSSITGGTARSHHSSVYYNDKIYIIGGSTTGSVIVSDIDIYSISTNTWSTATLINTSTYIPRTGHTSVWDKKMKRILTYGGINSSGAYQSTIHSLQISGSSIISSIIATPPQGFLAKSNHVSHFYDNGVSAKMFMFGGASSPSGVVTNSMQMYDMTQNTFKVLPSHVAPRKGMSGIKYYNSTIGTHKIVYFGGITASNSVTNAIDIFTIPRSSKQE